ncbi:hypothetical protein IAR55_000682 [Kwoniella newhampshirensis]|uniref:Major facilitator superfamily (MFS) profile domain-containing protein n=1 Tax=Kwoniella newhampshirensis TaxID=1651941 RepID=A0AAW0Z7M4_9TREE
MAPKTKPKTEPPSETQPLLPPEEHRSTSPSSSSSSSSTLIRTNLSSPSRPTNNKDAKANSSPTTPLPKFQLLIACFVRVTEPIAFMSCFPYINQMLLDLGIVDDPKKTGFYAGLIESIFAVAELLTVFHWGTASDRWGRKPVLLIGCGGAALSSILFGFSTTFPMMIVTRVINGLANGNVAVLKSVIAELCDETNQSRAFSFFPLSMAIGTILASTIGGYFPHIARRFPSFGEHFPIFESYPYLLPCLIAAFFPISSGILAFFFMKETLPPAAGSGATKPHHHTPKTIVHYSSTDDGDTREAGQDFPHSHPRSSDTTTATGDGLAHIEDNNVNNEDDDDDGPAVGFRDLLTPEINALMLSFGLIQLQGISFFGLLPLFCFTPVAAGGLGFDEANIGKAMSIRGISTIVVQLFAFPWLQRTVGTVRLYKMLVVLFVPAFMALPLTNVFARRDEPVAVWLGLCLSLGLYAVGNMAFACNLIMVNDAAPNRRSLGAINGWSQAVSSMMRAIGPATASTLFALSVDRHALGGNLIWVVQVVLSLISVGVAMILKSDYRKKK